MSTKQSTLWSALITSGTCAVEAGIERGEGVAPSVITGQTWTSSPLPPVGEPAEASVDGDRLLDWGRRLLKALIQASAAAPDQAAVRVSTARVERTIGAHRDERLHLTAQLLIGSDPRFPVLARTIPFRAAEGTWPQPILDAVAREARSARTPLVGAPAPQERPGPWVLDAFAACDLLRVAAENWERHPPDPGAAVAAASVDLSDPGEPFAPEGSVDAVGVVQRPYRVVEQGRWVRGPWDDAGSEADCGTMRQGSWREPPRRGWRSLRWDGAAPAAAWPDDAEVVTRLVFLRGGLLICGHRRAGGDAVARWGPIPAPPASWWIRAVRASLPASAPDATGWPIEVPPLLL